MFNVTIRCSKNSSARRTVAHIKSLEKMGDELLRPGENIRPVVTLENVKEIISQFYGLNCESIKELNGYDDKNYRVMVSDKSENVHISSVNKDGYVLKIINSLDSKKMEFFDAQTELLLYLGKQDTICCQKPIRNIHGKYFSKQALASGEHIIRLLEYISGTILHEIPVTGDLLYECGQYIAKLDIALKDFRHPGYDHHKTVWMLDSVPEVKNFLFAVKDKDKVKLVSDIVEQFEERVLKISSKLEKGLIHGDFNEQNILVEKSEDKKVKIKAILDFGDSHIACYLYELAISMAYMMVYSSELDSGGYVLAGYRSIRQLPDVELKLLRVCIAARLCQSLVFGAYSYMQDPRNKYVLITAKRGWSLLSELWKNTDEEIINRWIRKAEEITSTDKS